MNEGKRKSLDWIDMEKVVHLQIYKKENVPFNHLIVFDTQDVNLSKQHKHLFCNPQFFDIFTNMETMFCRIIELYNIVIFSGFNGSVLYQNSLILLN